MTISFNDSQTLCLDPDGGMARLLEIMRRLRDPETGCPWDIEQTYETIAPYTIEEAYEVRDAINRADWAELRGELGDLLLQVVYFAQMGAEDGHFDFDAIVKGVADKMVARHPHIFGDESRDKTAEQQTVDWERIKAGERAASGAGDGALDGVAAALPALLRAGKLQKRAARVGFDWPDFDGILDKIAEESRELVAAQKAGDAENLAEEMGDLLFVMANLSRRLGVEPEAALRDANDKFTRRFKTMEDEAQKANAALGDLSLDQMEALWQAAKASE